MYIYSKNGLDLTKLFEGCRLTAYRDSVGVWTIGYGHTKGVCEGMTCTMEQAEAWLVQDVQEACGAVNRLVKVGITQNEFDALVDFVFNLGIGNFAKSTLLRKLNALDFHGAANEFEKWDMAGGRHLPGLLRRRKAERVMFEKDL